MTLGKQAACLRTVGSINPDPGIAELEAELKEIGNTIGMGAMGFMGSSMVVDCHIEAGYCHTGGMPMSVHMFCLSSRRATCAGHTRWQGGVPDRPGMVHRLLKTGDGGMASNATKLKTARLKLPASTEDLRGLEIGTVVYLDGRIFTAREGVYKKAVEDGAGMPATVEEIGNVQTSIAHRPPPSAMMAPTTWAQ